MSASDNRDLETIIAYTRGVAQEDFSGNGQLVSSVSYQITILGEATKRLSDHLKLCNPHIPWKDISGMRNHLIHAYDQVDVMEIWRVVFRDIPILIEQLRGIERELTS